MGGGNLMPTHTLTLTPVTGVSVCRDNSYVWLVGTMCVCVCDVMTFLRNWSTSSQAN